MMHRFRQWTAFRTSILALGLLVWASSGVRADAIISYNTLDSGIDATGVTGTNVISFLPISNNNFHAPSSFSLGDFQVVRWTTASPRPTTIHRSTSP